MLTQTIVQTISGAIYERRLPPGTKLNERELADIFGVSRTVIRQALIRLSQEELITISPKRASQVAHPSFQEAFDLYQILHVVESGVVDILMQTITPEQIAMLREHTAKEHAAFKADDHDLGDRLGRGFHTLLIGCLGNEPLNNMHARLRRKEALITALYKVDFDYCHLRGEHIALVDSLETRDSFRAKQLLASHNNLVIKGYRFDVGSAPDIDLRAALQM
jgi:DNA-binding GntR family transcriptional regulator